MRPTFRFLACLFVLPAVAAALWGQAPKDQPDSIDKDYSAELPRIKPTEPDQAAATFTVAKGFRIDLVAAEPLLADPVAICFDENLRMFVCEMRGYSEQREENHSQIRLLTDPDGDGKYDQSTVFADKLKWPTALFWSEGRLIVADAPDIFSFKDTDGDGKADEKKVLFTGFGISNVQGLVNTFLWGLDNRIYGATSSSGAEVTRPDDTQFRLSLRGRDFALDPRTMTMTATSGGAQHGMSISDWGDRFLCSNSDHIQQVLFEDAYIARNPFLAAPSPRKSIAVEGPQADVFRTSPVEPWRIVRTRLRAKGIVPGVVEGGGRPAGYFTGATGVTIYRGNAWPEETRGLAIVGDVGSNLVHRKKLKDEGLVFTASRIDEKSELASSSDVWFRPVQYANAPDGTLYVCDMYRETIEHPASLHPVIKKHLDLTSGRDRGRIWRIVPEGFVQPKLRRPAEMMTAELVEQLASDNGWHRETAARLLYERQDTSAMPLLVKLAGGKSPLGRMHALYALDGLGALDAETLLPRLTDDHPRVRQHAVKLAEKLADVPAVRQRLLAMPADADYRVRYQAAFTLGQVDDPRRAEALAALAKQGGPYMPLAVQSSLASGAGQVFSLLAADGGYRASADGKALLRNLAAQIGQQQSADDVAAVLTTLSALAGTKDGTLQVILQGLALKPGTKLAEQVAAATGGKSDELMRQLVTEALAIAADENQKLPARLAATQQLRLGKLADVQETLVALLEPAQPADLQSAALSTLATFSAPDVAATLLERFAAFSPRLKGQATDALLSRPAWAIKLLEAIESGDVSSGDVDPARLKLLADHRDEAIRSKAAALVMKFQVSKRGDVVEAYKDVLDMPGDAERGKQLFAKVCAACHKVQGVGHDTGPNIAAMKNRGPEAILLNVLDPNREVNPQYLSYAALLEDGRTITGLIASETATSLTFKRADNATDTVLRIDIQQLKSTGQSLMPEGMEKQIDKQAMADLLAYFKTIE
ncbi:MAG TPA: PVC-type heme-binding CxxCH protein [Pirellulaceae bacterium]|nr:PVC-type heme-binding CxxCH protein [Pirellulaceae bacterium]